MIKKLIVVKETKTGRNLLFKDTTSNEILNSTQVSSRIRSNVPGYSNYYSRMFNGKNTIQRKPDGNPNTNLG